MILPIAKNSMPSFKSLFISILFLCLRFIYGCLFGAFFWWIVIEPYTRFFNFGLACPAILLSISLTSGIFFALSRWLRSVMVLFLPSMIGNASQNYIIMLLFINLFSGPVKNVALNAVESVRVIGCSLTLTFEHLRERAKLIMAPVVDVLSNSIKSDLDLMKQDLSEIQGTVVALKEEAEFSRNHTDLLRPLPRMPDLSDTDETSLLNDLQLRLHLDPSKTKEILNKTKELISSSKLEVDGDRLGLRASIDTKTLRQLLKANMSGSIEDFNLTKIMHESCLSVFRGAKSNCDDAVEEMRQSCRNSVGAFLSNIFCAPVLFTLDSICPWIMNQVIDETSLCKSMQASVANITIDPFNVTGGADINSVYKNLTDKLISLNEDIVDDENIDDIKTASQFQRLELSISINDKTLSLLLKTRELWLFITDKYKWRNAFYQLLLFLYELYTTLTFVSILLQAIRYQRNYLKDIRYDNYYITGMFRRLDQKRQLANKETVLPLTREESQKFITTFTCKRRTSEERRVQRASCVVIILAVVAIVSLLYVDDVFYSILSSIHEHALIRYRELGHHELQVTVRGEGPLARMVKRLTERFNTTYDLNKMSSTSECLPRPEATTSRFYVTFLCLMSGYLFIDQMSIYAMRLRRVTVAFFYTDREHKRIAFLYEFLLTSRRRLKRDGFSITDYQQEDNDSDDDDGNVYTIRDAAVYMKNCITDSICCRGGSLSSSAGKLFRTCKWLNIATKYGGGGGAAAWSNTNYRQLVSAGFKSRAPT